MGPERPSLLALVVAVVAVGLLFTLPRYVNEDSRQRFEALDHLLDGNPTTHPETKYSIIGPLFAAPLWPGGRNAVELYNRVLALVAAVGMWWALRPAISVEVLRRFLLILGFASMLPCHLMFFGGEVFTTVCFGFGSAAYVLRRWKIGLIVMAIGAANTPATIPALALGMGVLIWHERKLRYVLPVLLAVGLVLIENVTRHGGLFTSGYEGEVGNRTVLPFSGREGFSYPLFFGVLSVLFSFGKGLVWFTPGLFVPMERPALGSEDSASRLTENITVLYRMWIAIVVGLVIVYSCWWSWYGGYFWGPRFFLFACLPASLALATRSAPPVAGSLGVNVIVLAALALSCWVGANGVVYQQYGDEAFIADGYRLEFVLWYVPECSPLWMPFVQPKPLDAADRLRLAAFAVGAIYLLMPLAARIARQLRDAIPAAWPRFRL